MIEKVEKRGGFSKWCESRDVIMDVRAFILTKDYFFTKNNQLFYINYFHKNTDDIMLIIKIKQDSYS